MNRPDPQNDIDSAYTDEHELDFGALGFIPADVTAVVTKDEFGQINCVTVTHVKCEALSGKFLNLKPLMNEWALKDLEDEIRESKRD